MPLKLDADFERTYNFYIEYRVKKSGKTIEKTQERTRKNG